MKVRAFKVDFNEGSYTLEAWFRLSIRAFQKSPSLNMDDYDFVQLIPLGSYRAYFCGNDGAQGFRHRETGWTIPDYCRQKGGRPEIWNKTHVRQLQISSNSPIWSYLVVA